MNISFKCAITHLPTAQQSNNSNFLLGNRNTSGPPLASGWGGPFKSNAATEGRRGRITRDGMGSLSN